VNSSIEYSGLLITRTLQPDKHQLRDFFNRHAWLRQLSLSPAESASIIEFCKDGEFVETAMNVEKSLMRLLHSISYLLAVSAALIVFIVMPYVLLEHWHLLPGWQGLQLIYVLFPLIIAWMHAGFIFIVIVVACELLLVDFKSATRSTKIEAAAKISACLLAYLFITIGNQLNLH